jgi:hypothetical protein
MPHVPECLTWQCAGCADPWPCPAVKRELLAEYADGWPGRLSLSIYLAICMADALPDLAYVPSAALYNRFLGWTRNVALEDTHA